MSRCTLFACIAGLTACAAALPPSSLPALAQDVGTAAAVNTLSQSTPPGGGTRVLQIGARIVHNERIQTSATGTVQLLFVDKTTLSVGPNSTLLIDKFVYDPASNTGQMVTSLTKGALRFVGGQLSHQGAVTVKTPVATIGIRGGTATIAHGRNGTRLINHFGQLSVTNGGGTNTIRRPGFAVTITDWNRPPVEPARVSQPEINTYLTHLTSQHGQRGGSAAPPSEALLNEFGVGQFGGFGPSSQPIQQQTTHVENIIFDTIVQATQKAASPGRPLPPSSRPAPPPPPPPPPP